VILQPKIQPNCIIAIRNVVLRLCTIPTLPILGRKGRLFVQVTFPFTTSRLGLSIIFYEEITNVTTYCALNTPAIWRCMYVRSRANTKSNIYSKFERYFRKFIIRPKSEIQRERGTNLCACCVPHLVLDVFNIFNEKYFIRL
jgi:hypothetical protein